MSRTSRVFKTFGAFIRQAAGYGIDKAIAIATYVEKAEDTAHEVRNRIRRAHETGIITGQRCNTLNGILDELHPLFMQSGRIVDMRDSKDWIDIGNGARMHWIHKDSERMR